LYWSKNVQALHTNQRNERRVKIETGRPRGMQFVTYANYKHAQKIFASEQRRSINDVEKTLLVI